MTKIKYIDRQRNKEISIKENNSKSTDIPYNCDNCGKVFLAKRYKINDLKSGKRKRIFCSKECANNALYTSSEKECLCCGKNFKVFNCVKDTQKFCSKECHNIYKHDNAKYVGKPIPCLFCRKDFIPRGATSKYCSYECSMKSQQKREKCTCAYCGKEFERIISEINKNTIHYCSNECRINGIS